MVIFKQFRIQINESFSILQNYRPQIFRVFNKNLFFKVT